LCGSIRLDDTLSELYKKTIAEFIKVSLEWLRNRNVQGVERNIKESSFFVCGLYNNFSDLRSDKNKAN